MSYAHYWRWTRPINLDVSIDRWVLHAVLRVFLRKRKHGVAEEERHQRTRQREELARRR